MNNFLEESLFAGVTLSLIAYLAGSLLRKKFKLGIFNPLLISIAVSIAVLAIGNISYETYNEGAKYLSWLLTPATVCLAIPLYEQWSLLKQNCKAVMLGLAAGTVTSLGPVLGLSLLCGLDRQRIRDAAAEIHHHGYRHGCFGRTGRLCDHHGRGHCDHWCSWQYVRGSGL